MGQVLSTRPDLLPPALIEELATLQEKVTPLTEQEVVAAMERELGVPWEDVFASIEPEPIAAGTIGQVHFATLESGERVVVKINGGRRSRTSRSISDCWNGWPPSWPLAGIPARDRRAAPRSSVLRVVATRARLRREAANVKRMAEVLAPYTRLAVPKVYEDYSTPRLLVMDGSAACA